MVGAEWTTGRECEVVRGLELVCEGLVTRPPFMHKLLCDPRQRGGWIHPMLYPNLLSHEPRGSKGRLGFGFATETPCLPNWFH